MELFNAVGPLERVCANLKKYAHKVYGHSGPGSPVYTYAQMDEASGKVYAYLKRMGIGQETFVLVHMPRDIRAVACALGVNRAGAAVVAAENTDPEERVEFIRRDCGCPIVLNEALYETIMATEEPLEGHEEVSLHNAAFAVYTSGTTGRPKGTVLEFGILNNFFRDRSVDPESPFTEEDVLCTPSPLNFVTFIGGIYYTVANGCSIVFVPRSRLGSLQSLYDFMAETGITLMFMTPSLAEVFPRFPETLKTIVIAGEPAHNLYIEGITILNMYAMSECAGEVSRFYVDRRYDTVPAGKPRDCFSFTLLTEEGEAPAPGEPGEICIDSPYSRGYLNLPEETARTFRGGLYHTGDLARVDEQGVYHVLGRIDDMVKVAGNRIEPAEIERACREVLGLTRVVARGFTGENRAYVCLYYLADDPAAASVTERLSHREALDAELLKKIPKYMLPTYYVAMEDFPRNDNGKVARKLLPEPEAACFAEGSAEPAVDEPTRAVAEAFAKVLGLPEVGATDDFYLIGGDSIRTYALVLEEALAGASVYDVFKYRTPAKLAAFLREHAAQDEERADAMEEEARKRPWKLSCEQRFMLDLQKQFPGTTLWNNGALLRMRQGVEARLLAEAVNRAMRAHPAFCTQLIRGEDGEVWQTYDPERFTPARVVEVGEEELLSRVDTLLTPYDEYIGRPLYRCIVFGTEAGCYLFLEVWHVISDAVSMQHLAEEVARCYHDPAFVPAKDRFYLIRSRKEALLAGDAAKEAERYYLGKEPGTCSIIPEPDLSPADRPGNGSLRGTLPLEFSLSAEELDRSTPVSRMGRNGFFALALMLAHASISGCSRVLLGNNLHGRHDASEAVSFGLYYTTSLLTLDFTRRATLAEACGDLAEQMRLAPAYGFYPADELVPGECLTLVYRHGYADALAVDPIFEEMIEIPKKGGAEQCCISLDEWEGTTFGELEYRADLYSVEKMKRFTGAFRRAAELLLRYADVPETPIGEILRQLD